MNIFFHHLKLSGESALSFAKHDVEFPSFCIFEQPVKRWSVPITAGEVIIAVNVVNLPIVLRSILCKHRLLVFDALAVIEIVSFIMILFRKSAIYSYFVHFIQPPVYKQSNHQRHNYITPMAAIHMNIM